MTGLVVLVLALVVASLLAAWKKATEGRFRGADDAEDLRPLLGALAGERATLLQLSSAFCAPCRTTRVVLADIARAVPGVAHVELDAESHLELVRHLGVLKTPTTLVLDARGREVTRASGVPSRPAVLSALELAVT